MYFGLLNRYNEKWPIIERGFSSIEALSNIELQYDFYRAALNTVVGWRSWEGFFSLCGDQAVDFRPSWCQLITSGWTTIYTGNRYLPTDQKIHWLKDSFFLNLTFILTECIIKIYELNWTNTQFLHFLFYKLLGILNLFPWFLD